MGDDDERGNNGEGGEDGSVKKNGGGKIEVDDAKVEEDIDIGDPGSMTIELRRRIVARDDPYYPKHLDSDNPYHDGYVAKPPRKPCPTYLFCQGKYRSSYFGKKYPMKALPEVCCH